MLSHPTTPQLYVPRLSWKCWKLIERDVWIEGLILHVTLWSGARYTIDERGWVRVMRRRCSLCRRRYVSIEIRVRKVQKKTIPMRAESQQIAWCDANPMFWLTRSANLAIAPRSSGAPRQDRVRTWQHYLASWKDQIIPYVGRVSTDRSMEAALLDTTPLWVNKSYTSDLVARHWNQSDPARQPQGIPPRDKVINRADAVIRKPLRVTSQRQEAIISLQWLDRILT